MLPLQAINFPDWLPNGIQIGPAFLSFYGLSYLLSFLFCYLYSTRMCRKPELWTPGKEAKGLATVPNKTVLEDYMFFIILGVIVGGRIGYVLLYGGMDYLRNPLDIFKVWEGGMSFHGGFTGVALGVFYVSRKYNISLLRLGDIAAISTPIALGLVRLANFVNQELYGHETDLPWGIYFKNGGGVPRHPSQLYEAALEGALLWLIIRIATHRFKALTKPGIATGLFIGGYGSFRFFVEFFRVPDADKFGPLTRGMAYSLPMIIIGLGLVIWAARRDPVAPAFMKDEDETKEKSA